MIVPFKPLPGTTIDPRFPDEDGRPMGDTDFHTDALIWLRQALEDFFAGATGWYVATNLILYWDETSWKNRRDPDILVARGVGSHRRRSFRVWEEGTLPCALCEVASRKTWREDVGEKSSTYARIGVPEYFIFDPEGRYVRPPLQGFRLRKGAYVPIKPGRDGGLASKQLGLGFRPEGPMLRVVGPDGNPVLTRAERVAAMADELERLRAELKRRKRSKE